MIDYAKSGASLDKTTKNSWVKDTNWQTLFQIASKNVCISEVTKLQDFVTHSIVDRFYSLIERLVQQNKKKKLRIEVIDDLSFWRRIHEGEINVNGASRQNNIDIPHLGFSLKGGYKNFFIQCFNVPFGIYRCRRRFRSGTDRSATFIPISITVFGIFRLYLFQILLHDR